MLVRLPEIFHQEAKDTVKKEKCGKNSAIRPIIFDLYFAQGPENGKEQKTFQAGLIKLGGVAAFRSASGEDHGPGDITYPAVKFAVNKIADPAQAEPDGNGGSVAVGSGRQIQPMAPAEDDTADNHPQQTAMEGHAPLPGGENLQRMVQVIGGVIEKDITQPTPCDQAQEQGEIKIVETGGKPVKFEGFDLVVHQQVAGGKAQEIHQAVPVDFHRTQA